jgi:hypothetical protein
MTVKAVNLTTGNVSLVAGTGNYGNTGDGGLAVNATFGSIQGLTLDTTNQLLYISDNNFFMIRVVDLATNIITRFAGTGVYGYTGDGGPANQATFGGVNIVYVDSSNNLGLFDIFFNLMRISLYI